MLLFKACFFNHRENWQSTGENLKKLHIFTVNSAGDDPAFVVLQVQNAHFCGLPSLNTSDRAALILSLCTRPTMLLSDPNHSVLPFKVISTWQNWFATEITSRYISLSYLWSDLAVKTPERKRAEPSKNSQDLFSKQKHDNILRDVLLMLSSRGRQTIFTD